MALNGTSHALENVLRNPAIWRAQQVTQSSQSIATGFAALDKVLPEAGWPISLTELLVNEMGAGELSLLTPALRTICAEGRGIALIGPPYLPQARAWQSAGIPLERLLVVDTVGVDVLWSAEQSLRSGECGAVLLWGQAAGRALNYRALQRLQLAASTGGAACFLYRSLEAENHASPAPLRIRLTPNDGGLRVQLVKSRGATQDKTIGVQTFPAHWREANAQRAAVKALSAATAKLQATQTGSVVALGKVAAATVDSQKFITEKVAPEKIVAEKFSPEKSSPVRVSSAQASAALRAFPEVTPAHAPLPFPLQVSTHSV